MTSRDQCTDISFDSGTHIDGASESSGYSVDPVDLLAAREYIYLIAYSVVANIVLASVYRRRPAVAMYICLVNVVLVAWFVMRTDRYNEKLIGQCESSTLL
jgi:uncharacterized membrane protein YjgN (DUF898 family)